MYLHSLPTYGFPSAKLNTAAVSKWQGVLAMNQNYNGKHFEATTAQLLLAITQPISKKSCS